MTDEKRAAMRVDKWLWFTRFFKTRSLATAAVKGGHIRVNGERARPGNRVSRGDRLRIVRNQQEFEVTVEGVPERRGPASEAAAAYLESDESRRAREEKASGLRSDRMMMPTTRGRPDKHTRRALRGRNRSSD